MSARELIKKVSEGADPRKVIEAVRPPSNLQRIATRHGVKQNPDFIDGMFEFEFSNPQDAQSFSYEAEKSGFNVVDLYVRRPTNITTVQIKMHY